jgi:hypothetical protein
MGEAMKFVFTCGCSVENPALNNNNSRACPVHPQRSLKEVVAQCGVCGEEIIYKAGQYKVNILLLCRKHKIIRERFMSFNSNCKAAGKPLPVWETYLAEFEQKNAGKMKSGPRI